jgi:hypothetical protein
MFFVLYNIASETCNQYPSPDVGSNQAAQDKKSNLQKDIMAKCRQVL